MMIVSRWFALGVALVAFGARAEEKPRIVVLQIDGSTDALKRIGAAVSEQVLTELQRTGRFDAMGTSDLQVLLGMERQRSLLGCSPEGESACLAEISAALENRILADLDLLRLLAELRDRAAEALEVLAG